MGQYYIPILQVCKYNYKIHKTKSKTFAFDSIGKLTEFDKNNHIINLIADIIKKYNKKGWDCHLVFSGDYTNPNPVLNNGMNLYEYYLKHKRKKLTDVRLTTDKKLIVNEKEEYLFHSDIDSGETFKYIINLRKEEWYDVSNNSTYVSSLALLTADGNHLGNGGDYKGNDYEFVGRWRNDEIIVADNLDVVNEEIAKDMKYKNSTRWQEIKPNFCL